MDNARGSCLCGDAVFVLTVPSKWVAHCHCSLCRRAHGAAFVTWVGMHERDVAIADPQSRLQWYASTPGAERGFCSRCGSTLFFRSRNWPGELHVAHANLHDPADRAPQAHAYWDSRVDWASVDPGDGLKRMPAPKDAT
ncbi:MAG: GFA family protein [Luteimonas sp.]